MTRCIAIDPVSMQSVIRFEVPGLPVAKGRARHGKTRDGRPVTYAHAATKSYEGVVRVAAAAAMNGAPPMDEALRCEMEFYLPVPASWSKRKRERAVRGDVLPTVRPDLDNLVKAIKDALNGIVWVDDSRVCSLSADKWYDDRPRVRVLVRSISAATWNDCNAEDVPTNLAFSRSQRKEFADRAKRFLGQAGARDAAD